MADAHPAPRATLPLKVAIVEDMRALRESLALLIAGTPGYRSAGVFGSMEEALERIPTDIPDVALVDIGLPGMSGLEGIPLLKERYPHLNILTFTVYDDDERIFQALCAGACGYLLKKTPPRPATRKRVRGGRRWCADVSRNRAARRHTLPAVPASGGLRS